MEVSLNEVSVGLQPAYPTLSLNHTLKIIAEVTETQWILRIEPCSLLVHSSNAYLGSIGLTLEVYQRLPPSLQRSTVTKVLLHTWKMKPLRIRVILTLLLLQLWLKYPASEQRMCCRVRFILCIQLMWKRWWQYIWPCAFLTPVFLGLLNPADVGWMVGSRAWLMIHCSWGWPLLPCKWRWCSHCWRNLRLDLLDWNGYWLNTNTPL